MLRIERTNASNPIFRSLVNDLDKFLAITDGDDHAFYDQYNQLDDIKYVLIVYKNEEPIGCGAIKQFDLTIFEIKRMYISEAHRGNGYAGQLLKDLENWAKELGAVKCILETGIRQSSAVHLYKKNGYRQTENYGQYVGVNESLCFEIIL